MAEGCVILLLCAILISLVVHLVMHNTATVGLVCTDIRQSAHARGPQPTTAPRAVRRGRGVMGQL